jgi:hypothetical protein
MRQHNRLADKSPPADEPKEDEFGDTDKLMSDIPSADTSRLEEGG